MILNIITTILIATSLYFSFKDFLDDKSLLKFVYLNRKKDYIWSLGLVIFVFALLGFLSQVKLPEFFNWSWVSFLSDGKQSGNVMSVPFTSGSKIFILFFWFILSLALPYLAKSEEESFRSNILTLKWRILNSIGFGLVHMIVGVPLSIALVLSLVGFIFSIFYIRTYRKYEYISPEKADYEATLVSTSIHAKYNFILVSIAALIAILVLN
jgi:membrane protease YdiL (CAAX protease family)